MDRTPSVKRNLVANYSGKLWIGFLSLIFVPVYVRLLGISAYGLVGLYATLLAFLAVLDLGLSQMLNRELARLSATEGSESEARDLLRTLELVYGGITAFISFSCIALAPWAAHSWVHTQGLPVATVARAMALMGVVLAFQWPESFYLSGLVGLQRQVLANSLAAVRATVQAFGAVFLLRFVSHDILTFFLWQAGVNAVYILILRARLWRLLPPVPGHTPRFQVALWRKHQSMTLGMAGILVGSTLLAQMDRIVLSRLLPLEVFAYYALAIQVTSAFTYLVDPVCAATFPRFCQLVTQNEEAALARLYHQSCLLLAVILFPLILLLVAFGDTLWAMYFRGTVSLAEILPILRYLLIGFALQSVLRPAFLLQIAHGWTRLSLYKNGIAVVCYLALLLWLIPRYGVLGAATARILIYAASMLIEVPLMHLRLLRGEMGRWVLIDLGVPLAVSAGIIGGVRLLWLDQASDATVLYSVLPLFFLCVGGSLLLVRSLRQVSWQA